MKDYLKKLTRTKFQAFLVVTITNIILLIGYLTGHIDLGDKINDWMPAINLVVQLVATAVYQWVEGSIDRAAQQQQVYVVPGSAKPKDLEAEAITNIQRKGSVSDAQSYISEQPRK